MNHIPQYIYNKEKHEAICILNDGIQQYIGIAICDPTDLDMESEKTGLYIAEQRALIKVLEITRDKLIAQIQEAKHVESLFVTKNLKTLEIDILFRRELSQLNLDLTTIRQSLQQTRNSLRNYLKTKDDFYTQVRKHREEGHE